MNPIFHFRLGPFSLCFFCLLVIFIFFSYVTGPSYRENNGDDDRTENLARRSNDQSEQCCGSNGIFSHEVLQDGESDSDSKCLLNKFAEKVTFLVHPHLMAY